MKANEAQEQYISKSALVAEIERWLAETDKGFPNDHNLGRFDAYKRMLSLINSLEVKELDLEKESLTWEDIPTILTISEQLKTSWWFVDRTKDIGTQAFWEEVLKRFKAQKGE